ncbi:Radical SAM N-terminal domain protein [Thermosinus carboxydivorans Nor1]|uniref:Radical SAM N-terminal domain protein n=1 Tax=Thermosinus carboxydivorans Nor1 TaxID=401526 RepID=A1HSD9_9FIRM|nr:YgiQ family radical SAM protein [Thermosinus carboxydivorans]EAX47100.1 Radical SAM N-terminal domain protein [Thermosinus carboxydivorans Nor1]
MDNNFLPISREDMQKRGWDQLDFLFVSGDAYVDHPSFGPAVICRLLEKYGYKVGIIAQPDWRSTEDFKKLGKPRLGVLVSAGNMDSMLNKFTAAKKYRSKDNYSPGGKPGRRPDRATIVYCNRIRELWKNIPLIIGGVEASLRRFAHYDYWSDEVRRSILIDSRADLLIYGMGERQIKEIAAQLAAGLDVRHIRDVQGTCYCADNLDHLWDYVQVPSYEEVIASKEAFAEAFKLQYLEQDPIRGKTVVQRHGDVFVVQNPPVMPLTTAEMDEIYDLPYQRTYHPVYEKEGGVPAIQEVKFSIVSHRGCFGGCSFCAIVSHQGRIIQSRSHESILREAKLLTRLPDFKGYIHDVGGPTANFRTPACRFQTERGACKGRHCLGSNPCSNLTVDHTDYLSLLRALRSLPGVKKVFIRSGLRYDYLLAAKDDEFLREICEHHVSGQLKVAPEHVSSKVTRLMGKSGKEVYVKFMEAYRRVNQQLGKEQYLVPYFMSSHPGAGLKEAVELAEFLRDIHYHPEQVQDFIPTPGSLSTAMYYSGINPLTGEKVYVAKDQHEKKLQRALMQYRDPKNYDLVYEALVKANRQDLIGYGPKCLIKPRLEQDRPEVSRKQRRLPVSRRRSAKRQRANKR